MQKLFHTDIFRLTRLVCLLFVLSWGLVSCNSSSYYDKTEPLENSIWVASNAKRFDIDIEDSLQVFNFYIHVRNSVDYEFANLYFFIQSEFPDGQKAQDTIECQLADYQGKWLGSGSGKFRDNSFILRKNMRFQKKGIYRFELKQGMRRDSLKGIAEVGIRLEKAK
jgi:gliding motility-associated lipoprotein GldH